MTTVKMVADMMSDIIDGSNSDVVPGSLGGDEKDNSDVDSHQQQQHRDGKEHTAIETSAVSETHPKRIGDYDVTYLIESAQKKIDKRTADWDVLNNTMHVPTLNIQEIEIGRLLGEGGFFKVYEIQNISLRPEFASDGEDDDTVASTREESELASIAQNFRSDDVGVAQNRRYLEKNCRRQGKNGKIDCRFALKIMKKCGMSDPGLFVNTLVDMAIEAKFLASVRHPNIIKMRGISMDFISAGADSFLILDRLYQILSDKITFWKDKKENSFAFAFDFRGKKQQAFLAERLTVAFDIASALQYLHDRNIIYRDLKPENLGFDVRGDIKLFDFGLATEFDKEKHGTYKLTGDTGTIRYMAPEVATEQSYSEKADVYSFGILLWQILALETPYEHLHGGKIEYSVCHLGLRPKLDQSWPPSMLKLLQDCFDRYPSKRPSMEVVCSVLEREANSLADKKLRSQEWMDASKTAQSARYFED